jgi:TatD DNase family protein
MQFIDSHAHIDGPEFDADRAEVLARARAAGVGTIVVIGSGDHPDGARRAVALCAGQPDLHATIGIHPHHAGAITEPFWSELDALAGRSDVVAIGETGLDYYYETAPRDAQQRAFARFITMARRVGKPVICHIRDAHDDARALLAEGGAAAVGGIIHCFTGTPEDARHYVAMGFHISFSGIVTFRGPSAEPIRQAVREVPPDRLLLETDCPYLAPVPVRGRRNEPAYLVHTAEVVARCAGLSLEALAEQTAANTRRLLSLT